MKTKNGQRIYSPKFRAKAAPNPGPGSSRAKGILYWIEAFMFRGTGIGPSIRVFPTVYDAEAARDVRVPWKDDVLNAGSNASGP